MLKKDDEIFNPFIKISEVHGREDFEEINLNSVHRALKYETIEASFVKTIFAKFASNFLTHDYVEKKFYWQICKSKTDQMKFFLLSKLSKIFRFLKKYILKTENNK